MLVGGRWDVGYAVNAVGVVGGVGVVYVGIVAAGAVKYGMIVVGFVFVAVLVALVGDLVAAVCVHDAVVVVVVSKNIEIEFVN